MHGLQLSVGGMSMAVLHLLLIATALVLTISNREARWAAYWTPFLALDFPLSLGVLPLAWMFPTAPGGPLADFANFWWPLSFHGVVGTWWWYIVGTFIQTKFIRWRAVRRGGLSAPGDDLGER